MLNLKKSFMKGQNRGPEYTKCIYKDNSDIHIGFHRLSINGLDAQSNQPFEMDNITLVCNGEIYNHNELFDELKIERQTNSDCEIILHLYDYLINEYNENINKTRNAINNVFKDSDKIKKPKAIIANTIKGKGFSFSENNNDWHHSVLTKSFYEKALKELIK